MGTKVLVARSPRNRYHDCHRPVDITFRSEDGQWRVSGVVAAAVVVAVATGALAAASQNPEELSSLVVELKTDTPAAVAEVQKLTPYPVEPVDQDAPAQEGAEEELNKFVEVVVSEATKAAVEQALEATAVVAAVAENEFAAPLLVPNDTLFGNQWGLHHADDVADVNGPEAWDTAQGSSDVVIAVIDTGMELTHPDLADHRWTNANEVAGNGVDDDKNGFIDDVNGWDFANNDNDPAPGDGWDTTGPPWPRRRPLSATTGRVWRAWTGTRG